MLHKDVQEVINTASGGVRGHRAVMDRHSLPDADPDPWAISLNECGPRWRLSISPRCLSGRDCLFGLGCNGSLHLAAWCWRTPPSSLFSLLCLPPPPPTTASSTHHLVLPPHHFSISLCFLSFLSPSVSLPRPPLLSFPLVRSLFRIPPPASARSLTHLSDGV